MYVRVCGCMGRRKRGVKKKKKQAAYGGCRRLRQRRGGGVSGISTFTPAVEVEQLTQKLQFAVMPDVQRLGHNIGGMRFCRSQGVELESERVLPTKQREEKERRKGEERDGWAGCLP